MARRPFPSSSQSQRQHPHERGLRHSAAAASGHRGRRLEQEFSRSAASGASAATTSSTSARWARTSALPPFFFAKPADAIVPDGGTVPYPSLTKDMHHEVELVVALKSGGRNIPVAKAQSTASTAMRVGIDLTRRDLQIASRDLKRPWEVGKAFDHSAPCGAAQAGRARSAIRPRARSRSSATARSARTAISTR